MFRNFLFSDGVAALPDKTIFQFTVLHILPKKLVKVRGFHNLSYNIKYSGDKFLPRAIQVTLKK